MKELLNHLYEKRCLSRSEACEALCGVAEGRFNPAQVAAFLSVFRMRIVTLDELAGFRSAMRKLCEPVDLSAYNPIDLCGTGGDGKDTFNISTLASFVVAGAGLKVAKHGNYGISSICGSSNVLEHLGVKFSNSSDALKAQIEESGICFLHAPLYHPAMKRVAGIRRELGIKTFFNMLGPLVNPAAPRRQLVGVYSLELARLYGYLLQEEGAEYAVVTSLDGYDEVSLTAPFKVITRSSERLMEPEQLGQARLRAEELSGGDSVAQSASIFMKVLRGQGTRAQCAAVTANAALAIQRGQPEWRLEDCMFAAGESLNAGRAHKCFEDFLRRSS